jgi:hypothetical protein
MAVIGPPDSCVTSPSTPRRHPPLTGDACLVGMSDIFLEEEYWHIYLILELGYALTVASLRVSVPVSFAKVPSLRLKTHTHTHTAPSFSTRCLSVEEEDHPSRPRRPTVCAKPGVLRVLGRLDCRLQAPSP